MVESIRSKFTIKRETVISWTKDKETTQEIDILYYEDRKIGFLGNEHSILSREDLLKMFIAIATTGHMLGVQEAIDNGAAGIVMQSKGKGNE